MNRVNVIAIDGPAGSGKSTIAKRIAEKLGFLYIDTGAMYRALTLKAIRKGLDFNDKEALLALSKNTDIEFKEGPRSLRVYLDGKDVTEEIRTMEVTTRVKKLASLKDVRSNMVKLQRKLGEASKGAVLEGRDIGTVVFKDARYKFYLDASLETRVKRRFDEFADKKINVALEEVRKDVTERDTSDMTREVGALKKAPDAAAIDTTDMTIEEVTGAVLKVVKCEI